MTVTRTHTYPEGTTPGVYTITVTDGTNSAQAQVTVLDSTPNTVTVDPTTVAPGGTVSVSGSGFPMASNGTVEILPEGGGTAVGTATFTTDGVGAMPPTNVVVDSGALPGDYTVNVLVGVSGGTADLTVATPLAAPAGLATANPTLTSLDLTWGAVANANQYQVEYRVDGAVPWTVGPIVAVATATISGLTSATTYDFRVTAEDTTGAFADSPPSAVVQGSTSTPLPQLAFPDDIDAAPLGTTGLTVTWDTRVGAVGYVVQYRVDGTAIWTQATQTTATTQDITGLTTTTLYEVQVQAVGDGTTNLTSEFGPTPPLEQTTATSQLAVPGTFFAEPPNTTSIAMTWDAVSGATAYHVQYKLDGATTWTDWTPDPTATSVTITGLAPAGVYDVRVKAVGNGTTVADSAYTAELTINMVALAAPANLTSPGQTATTVQLAWDAVTNATSYGVEWSPAGAGTWTEVFAGTNSTTVTGLTTATSYDFRVAARADNWVDSNWSTVLTQSTS